MIANGELSRLGIIGALVKGEVEYFQPLPVLIKGHTLQVFLSTSQVPLALFKSWQGNIDSTEGPITSGKELGLWGCELSPTIPFVPMVGAPVNMLDRHPSLEERSLWV